MTMFDYRDALELLRLKRLEAFGKDNFAYDWLSRITSRVKEASNAFYSQEEK